MYVIPCNYGVESIALIEWMRQKKYTDVHCLYVDTGWAAPHWPDRVKKAEEWVRSIGFYPKTLYPKRTFPELVLEQGKFPTKKFQWCASFLKGLPILEYLDFELDPEMQATIVLALRRSAARSLENLGEFIESSEHYNGRKIWHPLYATAKSAVDDLCVSVGVGIFADTSNANVAPSPSVGAPPRRSLECGFCVNAGCEEVGGLKRNPMIAPGLLALESAVGSQLYPEAAGDEGSPSVGRGEGELEPFMRGCGLPFGCGL
jgi:hypothetical protein